MKNPSLFIFALLCSSAASPAASVFWSFQNSPNANSSNPNYNGPATGSLSGGTATSVSGFLGSPDLTAIPGTAPLSVGNFAGGANYTDPATGILWEGNGSGAATPVGQNLQWGSGNTISTNAGAGFILSLNTVGLTDLSMRFDVRSAVAGASAGAITGFSSVSYRLLPSDPWTVILATTPTWALSGNYTLDRAIDLSSFDVLEGKESLELQFVFNGGAKTVGGPVDAPTYPTHNMRIDNLLVTAIPEPGSVALAGLAAAGFLIRRRRAGA